MTTITCQPIGIIRTAFTSRENTPRGVAAQNACGVIQMDPQYREAMADMHPGERYLVLFHFDRAKGFAQTVPIHGDGPMTGLFSTLILPFTITTFAWTLADPRWRHMFGVPSACCTLSATLNTRMRPRCSGGEP